MEGPQELEEEEASQSRYLVGTLETETAAAAAALFPHSIRLSAADIETAAILLQANARTGLRKGQTSFDLKPLQLPRPGVSLLCVCVCAGGGRCLCLFIK